MYRRKVIYTASMFKQQLQDYYKAMNAGFTCLDHIQLDDVGATFIFDTIAYKELNTFKPFDEIEVDFTTLGNDFWQTNITKDSPSFYERDYSCIHLVGTKRSDLIIRNTSPMYYIFKHIAEPIVLPKE